ncbi:aldo/keto reductase family protein [Paenibacillus tepidiphilus]|uniref:aldo/keto reductase family protein n=1 Tax=Paenibacillus tepidiphilus TaxID=2608683 RepID=UPI0012397FBC|nr:aldo/keto reductase family protein [Paenibacillus tepidiphilus]
MEYRNMGRSGLKLSEVALGSWMTDLKDTAAGAAAGDIIKQAYENGVNFFDCADAYSGGEAERHLGATLKQFSRSSYVISSKVFFPSGPSVNERGLSRKHIFHQIDNTLKNMQVDYVDLYFCHRFDPTTPMEETLQALSDLVAQGKILYYGVSEEWSAARINKAVGIIKDMGLRPMSVIQPQYHMFDRYIEHEIVEVCEEHGIGIVPFSPLAQGLLTGKYRKGEPLPEGSRATHQADKQINALLTDENLDKVHELQLIADELGVSLSVLALSWILRRSIISSVITGASSTRQLLGNVQASGFTIPADALERIEKILGFAPFTRRVG